MWVSFSPTYSTLSIIVLRFLWAYFRLIIINSHAYYYSVNARRIARCTCIFIIINIIIQAFAHNTIVANNEHM